MISDIIRDEYGKVIFNCNNKINVTIVDRVNVTTELRYVYNRGRLLYVVQEEDIMHHFVAYTCKFETIKIP